MFSSNNMIKNSSKRNLIVVLLIFALPVLIATTMYVTGWRPSLTANYGELVQPARFIENRRLQTIDNQSFEFAALHGKWTMVYFDTAECPEQCISQLFLMRQTHYALGKDQSRLQRIFILSNSEKLTLLQSKMSDYVDMKILKGEQAVLDKLEIDFGIDEKNNKSHRNIYLIDPQGNLMMRYIPGINPAGIRKDMERLLKYSSEK